MKKLTFFSAILILSFQLSVSQITFEKIYGGSSFDQGRSVRQTNDNGYIITGSTISFGPSYDVYLIKTDLYGDTVWTKTYGGPMGDYGYSVDQTNDNGYIIVGQTYNVPKGQLYIIKTNASGDTSWTKTYGGTESEGGYSVMQTNDNGYIITGYTSSYGSGATDVYLIKADQGGIITYLKNPVSPNELNLYPNPGDGLFYIEINNDDLTLEITNVNGKLIFNKKLNINSTSSVEKINLSSHPKGIYFILVKSENEVKVGKLLIR